MSLKDILDAIVGKKISKVVSCPSEPVEIAGIDTADAYTAKDTLGTLTTISVPESGILYSATLWDLDDEGSEIRLHIFKHEPTQIADDATYAPADGDIIKLVTTLSFASFTDYQNSQVSELTNIGKAYTAPGGLFYIQAETRSTPTIAAGSQPKFQLQIIPDDPDWGS